jgi:ATP-binding cassette subfamily B (MDR/TAP) protein 1
MADLNGDRQAEDGKLARILDRQLNGIAGTEQIKHSSLLAYTTPVDIFFIGISSLAAIIAGALNPLLTVLP